MLTNLQGECNRTKSGQPEGTMGKSKCTHRWKALGDIPSSLGGLVFCKDISSARGERFLELLQFKKKDSPIIYCVEWGREWTKNGTHIPRLSKYLLQETIFINPTHYNFIHSMSSAFTQLHAL